VVVAVAVNLLPETVSGDSEGGIWLVQWFERFVVPTQKLVEQAGSWGSAIEFNQSLVGTTQRLFNTLPFGPGGSLVQRTVLDPVAVKVLVYGAFVALGAVSIAASWRASRRGGSGPGLPGREAWEYSIVVILMLLLSPMSGRAHFGLLFLPSFCLARTAVATRDRLLWAILVVSVALTLVANKDLVGSTLYDLFLWSGATTLVALLLWAGCVYALWQGNPAGRAGRGGTHGA
ncbi:MAG: hypothetical protein KDD75_02635, partial [Caldilineaceae bacterium]|nr:hypothetical protein [Caldilineaceae bacterium]